MNGKKVWKKNPKKERKKERRKKKQEKNDRKKKKNKFIKQFKIVIGFFLTNYDIFSSYGFVIVKLAAFPQ